MDGVRRERAGLRLEYELWRAGYRAVAGIDEAGRGAWAGPVVAAAVVLPSDQALLASFLGRVDDSKRLTPGKRGELFGEIASKATAVAWAAVSANDIDQGGILPATKAAMTNAWDSLGIPPDYLLIDHVRLPEIPCPQHSLPKGDAVSLSIAAASIIAKVARDRWMVEQDDLHPGYGFARHKGYGTTMHREALAKLGPCPLHRRTFRPVAEWNLRDD